MSNATISELKAYIRDSAVVQLAGVMVGLFVSVQHLHLRLATDLPQILGTCSVAMALLAVLVGFPRRKTIGPVALLCGALAGYLLGLGVALAAGSAFTAPKGMLLLSMSIGGAFSFGLIGSGLSMAWLVLELVKTVKEEGPL